jgi:hypothetical protein
VRRAFSPKRHVFRRDFEQCDEQLMIAYASGVKSDASAILSLWNRAANRIDFYRPPNE